MLLTRIRGFIKSLKRLKETSIDSLLWVVNLVPSLVGFSLKKEKISVFRPFWIIHLSLLIYVYGVGNLVYQIYEAEEVRDYLKSYVNVSLLALIANNSYWFLKEWPIIQTLLKRIRENDDLATRNPKFLRRHKKMLTITKRLILIFYVSNYTDALLIYLPHRSDVDNDFSMTPCVGMEPLTATPNRQICRTLLYIQELTIMSVVLNFQGLLIIAISHTSGMYDMLSEELHDMDLMELDDTQVKEKITSIIKRHVLILETTDILKYLYSVPIGTNFASNAVCISLFFYLPLDEWLGFIPILIYCFYVFFVYCFLGQRLVNASEAFERAVYSCGWEKFDLHGRKIIYVMMIQAQKKVEILAADIIPVNIYTFATTLQAMFKFVTVIKF